MHRDNLRSFRRHNACRNSHRLARLERLEDKRLLTSIGDFNLDNALTVTDLEHLSAEIRGESQDPAFDLDRSGAVDLADRQFWVESVFGTYLGDSNLDGEFSTADLVFIFQQGKYEDSIAGNADWSSGDWNGDGDFNSGDLVAAFVPGAFETGPRVKPSLTVASPNRGATMVNVTRETIVSFSDRIDPATITPETLYLIAAGKRIEGTVHVSSNRRTATFFYGDALPAATTVRVRLDGDRMFGESGVLVDVDGDGLPGGQYQADFRTLPLARIDNTNVFGFVRDSMTGQPIAGATIRVDAFPEANVTTDENGRFELVDMPAPDFYVHIDGSTAHGLPDGFTYPNVGKPFHSVPGQTVQLEMDGEPFDVYLPMMALGDVQPLSADEPTDIGIGDFGTQELAAMFPELDPSVWEQVTLTIDPGSAINERGVAATTATIVPVPPDRIPAPLPSFVDASLVISIQAPGATNFDVPAPLTFPNLDGLAPGDRVPIMSFDHDAGKWRTVASATVSEDGSVIRTDPGEGVVAPGWHAVPPRKRPTIAQCQGEGCDQDKEEEDEGPDEPPAEPIRIAGTFATPVAAFDFGTANSALEENHQRVSATLDYTSERGYGWLNGQRTALDRGSNASTSPLTQDFIETPLAEFAVDLERGIYEVTVTMGDASQRRVGGGAVYEEKLGTNLTTEAGQFQTSTRRVIIDDGQLNLRFLGLNNFPVAVNAITVSFVADVPAQSLEPLEGVRFYALEQLDTGFTLRGSYTSRKEFLEGLLLVPNAPYRLSVFHPGPMSYGFTDFSSSSLSDGDVPVPSVTLLPTIGMDSDDDGLITPIEVVLGTAPNLADTDEDGISDLAEIQQGLNPLDDRGFPTGIVGTLPTNGSAARLVVTRTPADPEALTAYVATSRGVSVVDVSDFDNPTTLGEYPIAGGAMDVAIDATGDVLLAATRSSVHQFDVSDPVEVRLIRELPQPASRLETLGGFGLFASGEVLWSVDLANGETVASQIYTAGIGEIARDGELLYLLVGNQLQITQIDAGTFIERGTVSLPTSPGSLTVGAGIAYVTSQIRGGYMTIDVTDPDNPVLISESDVEAPAILPWQTLALNGSGLGMLAGAVQGQGRVDIVQTLDPTETNVVAAQIEIGNVANDVEIAAGIAFLANGSAGLQVFNYLPFDSAGNAPQITLDSAALDSNPQTPAIEVVSRSVQVIVPQTTDDVQVRSVELLMDGEVVVRDVSFPFNLPFIAPRLSADKSEFVIQVRATDTGGNTTTTQPTIIELVPDTTAPELVAAEPDGQRVYPDGLTRVALQFNEPLDGQQLSAESVQLIRDELGVIVPNTFELRFGNRLIVMTFDPLPVGDYSVAFDSERIVDLAGNAATSADLDINFSLVEGTIFWVGGDGNWNDPQNWDLERVPNESDIVRADVASDATITISANVNVLSLRSNEHIVLTGGTADFGNQAELAGGITIDGGTLAVTNELRLAGESSWRSGTVSGIGRLENHGNLQIGSTGVKYLDGTLINRGAIDLAEGAVRVRRTASTRPIQLVNAAAGTFTFSGAGQVIVQASGDNRFVNQGTLRIDTGELAAQIAIAFDNQGGTIDGQSGELDLRGGGVSTGGVIQLGPGTLLDYESGEHTFTGDYSGSGEGLVGLSGSASITVPAGDSATFALAGGGFLINGGNMVPAGELTISGDGQFLAGTLGGPGTVTNQGNLQISSASVKYLDGTLINRGTIDFTEGAVRVRRTASDRPIRLVNAAEGIFEVSRAGQVIVQASGDNGVLNRGLMRIRAAAALTVSMELLQEASGTIQFDVTGPAATDHGQLRLSSTATLAGTLQVVVPSVEDIPSGTELELISLGNQGSEAFTTIDTGGLDAQLERRLNSMLLVVA